MTQPISQVTKKTAPVHGRQGAWVRRASLLAFILALIGALTFLILIVTPAIPSLLGYHSYVIYGTSMEPAIKVGSLVVTKPANADKLQIGDIIVFRSADNDTRLTHRIVGVREDDGQRYFKTKGDASNGSDPLELALEDGAQQVAYHLPYLGYFVNFAKSPAGIVLLVVLPAIGLLALHLTEGRQATEENREATGEA